LVYGEVEAGGDLAEDGELSVLAGRAEAGVGDREKVLDGVAQLGAEVSRDGAPPGVAGVDHGSDASAVQA